MNPATLRIRQAESRDAPSILELYRQLVRPVATNVEVDVRGDRIEEVRADPHNFLWVLECDEAVVGHAFVTLCHDSTLGSQPYAVLENFVIDEQHRTKGYGARLMRYTVDFCYH